MLILVFCCCLVSVGYFSLINKTVVEGNIRFSGGNWKIRFSDIKTTNEIGQARNYRDPILTDYLISFYVDFKAVGDSIVYDIELSNDGSLDARLANVIFTRGENKQIKFEYSGIDIGDVLKSGEKEKIKVQVTYDEYSKSSLQETEKMQLFLTWVQAN